MFSKGSEDLNEKLKSREEGGEVFREKERGRAREKKMKMNVTYGMTYRESLSSRARLTKNI